MQNQLIQIFLILSILIGGALPAFSALNYNIKNGSDSLLFVNGTTGNVGVSTTLPIGKFEVKGGASAPTRIVNINGTFANLDASRAGLYVDVTAATDNNYIVTGSWSEVRTPTGSGSTYGSAVTGVYAEALHQGNDTVPDLMGLMSLANQVGSGDVTNAYGIYPQVWKGAGTIQNAYGLYYQGVPDENGDTHDDSGTVVNQYGLGIGHLTQATTNIGILLDDNTYGAATEGNFGILQEAAEVNSFAGNIGIGTTTVDARLTLHSTDAVLVDSHVNENTDGTTAIESHYRVGKTGTDRTRPSDVQKFRFFAGTGTFQEVAQIAVNTPGFITGSTIGAAIDLSTQDASGLLVKRLSLDEQKAIFANNVGIGSSMPQAKLDIDGVVYLSRTTEPSPATDRLYNDAGTLKWNGSSLATGGASLVWNNVTSTPQAMVVNSGYIINNAAQVTLTLPAAAAIGDVVSVIGGKAGANGWKIAQNLDQTIYFGSVATTQGATGYLQSTGQYDVVQLMCVGTDEDFVVIASQGNITVN